MTLAASREAEKAGWRVNWRYYRDFDSALASIRNGPEFKVVSADIERDMAAAVPSSPRLASASSAAPACVATITMNAKEDFEVTTVLFGPHRSRPRLGA